MAAGAVIACAPAMAAVAAPPSASPQVQVEAITKPSIVYVNIAWAGWLRDEAGALAFRDPVQLTTFCSGAFVSADGYVLTAGHCVDNQTLEGGKGYILRYVANNMVQQGDWDVATANEWLADAEANWKVEGYQAGSPPDRTVDVYRAAGTTTTGLGTAMRAKVVEFKSYNEGDVALLKVEPPHPVPALEVAKQAAETGTDIVAEGYPGGVGAIVDPKLEPSFKDGRISGTQTIQGVPCTEISAAASGGMSGGPVVDMAGRVLGTVTFSPGSETQQFNFMTATSAINALMTRNGLPGALGDTDRTYRAALTAYFAGRYHDAITRFDKVLAVSPDHALAQTYRAKSAGLAPTERTGLSTMVIMLIVIGSVIIVLAVVAVVLFLVLRRRKAPAPPVSPVPAPPGFLPADQSGYGPPAYLPPYGQSGYGPPPGPAGYGPPTSGAPASGAPTSGAPASGAPTSGAPASGAPTSGAPTSGLVDQAPAGPPTAVVPAPVLPSQWQAADAATTRASASVEPPAAGTATAFCTNCGTPHGPQARFCATCGRPLGTPAT